jgi:hypothetical protein
MRQNAANLKAKPFSLKNIIRESCFDQETFVGTCKQKLLKNYKNGVNRLNPEGRAKMEVRKRPKNKP